MKQKALLILFLCSTTSIVAQEAKTTFRDDRSQITMEVDINNFDLIREDIEKEDTPAPLRIAKLFPLDVNMNDAGVWSKSSNNEDIWTLSIKVPNSHGLIISYSEFYLPQDSKLYVYNEDKDYGATVYTHENNARGKRYMTETSWGDEIVLEYVAPQGLKDKPRLQTTDIGYKYREIYDELPTVGNTLRLNESQNRCIPNINCPEGVDWQSQKKGALRLITRQENTLYMCSGSLVNNVKKDKTPYVLTAAHCLSIGGVDVDPEKTAFFFDYEHPDCENVSASPAPKILSGAKALSVSPIDGGSDGALFKLNDAIPSNWEVYFNGWELSNTNAENTSGAVIQHPHGDVKKIALYTKPIYSDTWEETSDGTTVNKGDKNAHWLVRYSTGVTQGGSSGSPLFNQNGLIVGTLTGGATSCSKPNERDYYGKMWYHWDQYADRNQHMKKYLDPDNTGATKLDGMNQEGQTTLPPTKPEPEPEEKALTLSMSGDDLSVKTSLPAIKVRIVSQSGKEVYSQQRRDWADQKIPTSSWASGIYIVTVWVEDGSKHTQKIMK